VQFFAVHPDLAKPLQMPTPKGVMVATVAAGGAAQRSAAQRSAEGKRTISANAIKNEQRIDVFRG
jgi:uncharacterized protein YigA (DUF484 family)